MADIEPCISPEFPGAALGGASALRPPPSGPAPGFPLHLQAAHPPRVADEPGRADTTRAFPLHLQGRGGTERAMSETVATLRPCQLRLGPRSKLIELLQHPRSVDGRLQARSVLELVLHAEDTTEPCLLRGRQPVPEGVPQRLHGSRVVLLIDLTGML